MASGDSGPGRDSGSKALGFGSDDIYSSYEDYGNQDGANDSHSHHSVAANSAKDFPKSRMAKASVYPVANYSPPEESSYLQDVVSSVENTMKKHTDNIMRFMEGLSSRLSQLELYCYNIDKSIGEMRSDLVRNHGVSDSKLKSLEKHVQEVHQSVQVLKDKQELADTQKELAKLQLAQKESSTANSTQKSDENVSPSSEPGMNQNTSDAPEQRLALALPHHVTPLQPPITTPPVDQQPPSMLPPPPSSVPQVQTYYTPPPQISNVNTSSQAHYLPPPQSQIQDHSRVAPPPPPSVQSQVQSVPPYQQQWPQQQQQTVLPPQQQPITQPQIRNPHPQMAYSSYIPTHPSHSSQDVAPNIMSVQGSFPGPSLSGSETMPYGYGSVQSQPPTSNVQISRFGTQQQVDAGYHLPSGPPQAPPPGSGYLVYDNEGGRLHHHHNIPSNTQPHYQQNVYPLATNAPQRMSSPNMAVPHSSRGHPHNELIEKLVGMGYRGDHVVGVIQRLEESGQAVDFNGVLDRLNGLGGRGSQRGWSS